MIDFVGYSEKRKPLPFKHPEMLFDKLFRVYKAVELM